jgi:hypothetical protein
MFSIQWIVDLLFSSIWSKEVKVFLTQLGPVFDYCIVKTFLKNAIVELIAFWLGYIIKCKSITDVLIDYIVELSVVVVWMLEVIVWEWL